MKLREIFENYSSDGEFVKAVEQELLKLMEEKGDFVYGDGKSICSYNKGPANDPDKCSGCIFGQALQNLGWDDKEELDMDGYIDEVCDNLLDYDVPEYWVEIQKEQDTGSSWGELKHYLV